MRFLLIVIAALFLAVSSGVPNLAQASAGQDEPAFGSYPAAGGCISAKGILNRWTQSRWSKEKPMLGSSDYIPCYKSDSNSVRNYVFRYCPNRSPWTATNSSRNICYSTSEDCARAEMPQSWCIKCGQQ